MSGESPSSPWAVLGLTHGASEKEVRRAYAVKLKEIRPSEVSATFEKLRDAYETALFMARVSAFRSTPVEPVANEDVIVPVGPEGRTAGDDTLRDDPAEAFRTMQSLVQRRDYSIDAWRRLLNDPVLDAPLVGARFEYALVDALSENELKTEYTLSAGAGWQNLVESRYAWVSDGIRYVRRFPRHVDLRDALVDLRRTPQTSSAPPVRKHRLAWALHPGLIALVALGLLKVALGMVAP